MSSGTSRCAVAEDSRRFGRTLIAAYYCLRAYWVYFSTLKAENVRSSETSVNFYQTTRLHIADDDLHIWIFLLL
jgi:hypothetical protein